MLTTIGAGVVIYVAAPEIAAAAAVETTAAEVGLTFVHGYDAVGHLLIAPLFAVGDGINRARANCGKP